jgi:hypothetical protein
MSNLTVNDRNQYERAVLTDGPRLSPSSAFGRRVLIAYTLIGLAILAALTIAAVQVFDGWHHAIVIGDVIVLVFGLALWVYPERKRVY